ncbi:MAG TPA: alkaline phosphatase PhoX, partial [Acidimicrobiales bacterium]
MADARDGAVRLWLPPGFAYRSFHDTESPVVLDDGTVLPGRHDGMAAFQGRRGHVVLVRNHELNNPGPAFGDASRAYDAMAQGGTTTVEVTRFGEVVSAFTSLNGTQMNCSGGRMPWGSWITCEETVNGPDVGPDFTGVSNVPLTRRHGYIFEVPAGGQSDRQPVTAAGRFLHEAVAFDPVAGVLYMTEDNFGFPSGFYRYIPPRHPLATRSLEDGGRLQMLAVAGRPGADLGATQPAGAAFPVRWVDIDDPDPTFPYTPGQPAPTTNDVALNHVGSQGRAQGAARFSRLEGATYRRGV